MISDDSQAGSMSEVAGSTPAAWQFVEPYMRNNVYEKVKVLHPQYCVRRLYSG